MKTVSNIRNRFWAVATSGMPCHARLKTAKFNPLANEETLASLTVVHYNNKPSFIPVVFKGDSVLLFNDNGVYDLSFVSVKLEVFETIVLHALKTIKGARKSHSLPSIVFIESYPLIVCKSFETKYPYKVAYIAQICNRKFNHAELKTLLDASKHHSEFLKGNK